MRDIAMTETVSEIPKHTFLIYGDTRTGKTEFAATFPRPLIIADLGEGGYKTVRRMDRAKFFEPDVDPVIWGIENMNDLSQIVARVRPLVAKKRILSIVFDAFTFYTDFYLNKIVALQDAAGKGDNRQAYGQLGQHLLDTRVKLHSLDANIAWLCLAKHPDTDDPKGRPLIPGKQSDKFAAGTDFLIHSRLDVKQIEGKPVIQGYELRTKQYKTYIAGNRLGTSSDVLPDPFTGSYAEFITHLGYDVDAIRKGLPANTKEPIPAAASTTAAAPPVTKTATPQPKPVTVKGPTVTARPRT